MNIARRDKQRVDDERNGKKEAGERRGAREKERMIARARVKDTKKGFLVAYSVCKMGSQPLYTPHPSPLPPLEGCVGDPRAWIVPCRIARPEYLKLGGIIQYET